MSEIGNSELNINLEEVLLRTFETEFQLTKGVEITQSIKEDGSRKKTYTIEKPGYDKSHPDVYQLTIESPTKINAPTRTTITHKWTAYIPDVDVEHYTQQISLETEHQLIGGNTTINIVDTKNVMHGTKSTYADSNTPRFKYDTLDHPIQTIKSIQAKLKSSNKGTV